MAETRRKFDQDFREGAVRLVRETGKPIAQVARELGVNEGMQGDWVGHEGKRGSHKPWTAGHDVIDCALLERALAGVSARDAARVRDACARWRRLRFAVDATAYPRPDAGCSPGRGHVHNGACHCKDSS